MSTNKIVKEFPELFNGLEKLHIFKLKLHTDNQITPVQQPIQKVPYHFCQAVSDELRHLERIDVMEKVKAPTSWVNLVPALKPNGKFRLCVDMRKQKGKTCQTNSERHHHRTSWSYHLFQD